MIRHIIMPKTSTFWTARTPQETAHEELLDLNRPITIFYFINFIFFTQSEPRLLGRFLYVPDLSTIKHNGQSQTDKEKNVFTLTGEVKH